MVEQPLALNFIFKRLINNAERENPCIFVLNGYMYTLNQIAEILELKLVGNGKQPITQFLADSRSLQSAEETVFIALKTKRNNGHNYIPALIEAGVRSFIVLENEMDLSLYQDNGLSFLLSPDPLKSLQRLAAYHRQQYSIPVIGITGSNGKTVVKEWLYQLLKEEYVICRSPKSYNSQLGVPLSVLNLNEKHSLGIFEAGISHHGEMDNLASIVRPTLGVLTSIGTAHDEGFENQDQKISEKLKLLAGSDQMIINGLEKTKVDPLLQNRAIFTSEYPDADYQISFNDKRVELKSLNGTLSFQIPFTDKASVFNAATCALVLLKLGYDSSRIQQKMARLQPVALRLEIKKAINQSFVINDYYNSDFDSLTIAINYLKQQNSSAKRIVIVSDIEQSGIPASSLYRKVADLFTKNKIDLVVGIGKEISAYKPFFKADSLFFDSTQSFISRFRIIDHHFNKASILLKGARSFGFENISRLLQQKSHDTVFEVNLNKLIDNVNYYRGLLGQETKMMCMVKAMGYGSGGAEIARSLQHMGVNYLAVAYGDEGVELRESGITLPIMVMSPEEEGFEDIVNHYLEPEIYSFKVLKAFAAKLDSLGITEPYPIHLKIDTGMHRLGFETAELEELILNIRKFPQIKVKSVFSHLAASDNPDMDDFTREQISLFQKAFMLLEEELGYKFIKHICNSGGITRFKEAHFDMVRLGIGMYGVGVNKTEQRKLENVGTLRTRISQIKTVQPGNTVGYNRSGKIDAPTRIATIPIGYADGFSRLLGNGRHGVYLKGTFCKTVANICMDMCMIDVTNVACEEGDEVVIFSNSIQIDAMAQALGTIPYEVLTGVSARVRRLYIQE